MANSFMDVINKGVSLDQAISNANKVYLHLDTVYKEAIIDLLDALTMDNVVQLTTCDLSSEAGRSRAIGHQAIIGALDLIGRYFESGIPRQERE